MSLSLRNICVFCGSVTGNHASYAGAARGLGATLVDQGIHLVYGGAKVGLMGIIADSVLDAGGHVIGVLPAVLASKEVAHPRLDELRLVNSMHERKDLMAELSDAFIGLPGGLGTLDELLEMLTWNQLGIHKKPCGLLNVDGYFDPLLSMLDRAVESGFLWSEHRAMMLVDADPTRLVAKLRAYEPPNVERWVKPSEA